MYDIVCLCVSVCLSVTIFLTIFIDLGNDLTQVALRHPDTHHSQDGRNGVHIDGALLLCVEGIEGLAQTCGCVVDECGCRCGCVSFYIIFSDYIIILMLLFIKVLTYL